MQIQGLGIEYETGELLFPPMDERVFAATILQALVRNADEIADQTRITTTGTTFRNEIERVPTVDLGEPRAAGWTFLVNEQDPDRSQIVDILRPLANHRRMANPSEPLIYRGEPAEEWWFWLLDNYSSLGGRRPPHYVLMVGGPEQIPFKFQSLLQSAAAVGRVAFDSLQDLEAYVKKVIRLENEDAPVTTREAIVFAPDGGLQDPTYFSRLYMAKPLADEIKDKLSLDAKPILGSEATKQNLVEALRRSRPALVYTASHGLGAPNATAEIQKAIQGAICCRVQPVIREGWVTDLANWGVKRWVFLRYQGF
ncbi:MAG: hypothetical protein R3B84_18425 [Zavarzinella sp.]